MWEFKGRVGGAGSLLRRINRNFLSNIFSICLVTVSFQLLLRLNLFSAIFLSIDNFLATFDLFLANLKLTGFWFIFSCFPLKSSSFSLEFGRSKVMVPVGGGCGCGYVGFGAAGGAVWRRGRHGVWGDGQRGRLSGNQRFE